MVDSHLEEYIRNTAVRIWKEDLFRLGSKYMNVSGYSPEFPGLLVPLISKAVASGIVTAKNKQECVDAALSIIFERVEYDPQQTGSAEYNSDTNLVCVSTKRALELAAETAALALLMERKLKQA
jgi:hypothetical protein